MFLINIIEHVIGRVSPSPRLHLHAHKNSLESERIKKPLGKRYILRHCLSGKVMTAFENSLSHSEVTVTEMHKGRE